MTSVNAVRYVKTMAAKNAAVHRRPFGVENE
jgi:hypothetical protein